MLRCCDLFADTMCVNRVDGTYAHPKDCRAYVSCSHGTAYPAYCPEGLIYSGKRHGCDFDIDGKCPHNQGRFFFEVANKTQEHLHADSGGNPVTNKGPTRTKVG